MKQGQRSRFTIYNASAGSGKTYTLVKKYLAALFAAPRDDHYTHMLAITFTNRAVAEMKQRIVSTLYEFSRPEILKGPSPLFTELLEETATSAQKLHEKAQRVLTGLLHNYSAFNVETIDSFNHRIIRTFARDLKLPQNFEVSLEQYELLTKAVGQLVARAGTQPEITKVLVNFALSKTDEDKSWDIARDITAASKIIFDETETEHLAKLSGKSLQDFTDFKSQLYKKAAALKKEIVRSANEVLGALTKKAVPLGVFSRGALPKHFQKLSASIFDVYTNTLQQHLETGGNKLYVKTTPPAVAQCIDALTPFLLERYIAIKRNVFKHKLLDNVLKNLTPLSVINLVQREIEIIKEDENILPISEFNTLINNELKQQPVPFIYERLGEKYHHFFIDEFQDTSAMQWQNLLPLIDNALAQQHAPNVLGSLLLVGDAKQSIYRWRGGLPEQFMGLYGGARPFPAVAQTVEDLSTNWRSYDQIVNFNNGFFSFLSSQFQNAVHSQLYQMGSAQKPNAKKGGHVQLQFITSGNKEAAHQMYAETVLETIHTLKQKGFALAEMCVITRTRKDGTVLANALLGAGVNITSSETLLLNASTAVQGLVHTLTYCLDTKNETAKLGMLDFFAENLGVSTGKHDFFQQLLPLPPGELSEKLKTFTLQLDFEHPASLPLYEGFEYLLRQCELQQRAGAHLFGFMDLVLEFSIQQNKGARAFLEFWETKKETAAIATGHAAEAVRFMTIHQSKGLEFPVVLFPYANVKLYKEIDPKAWYPWEGTPHFEEVLISYKNEVAAYGPAGEKMAAERQETLQLDAINLLYVTLTRAVEQLYVFSEKPGKATESPSDFPQLFRAYLQHTAQWDEAKAIYRFGTPQRVSAPAQNPLKTTAPHYCATTPISHNLSITGKYTDTLPEALNFGNLLHTVMAKIETGADAAAVFDALKKRGVVAKGTMPRLEKSVNALLNHPGLKGYFNKENTILNERDIVTGEGLLLRPDRVIVKPDGTATILDYKTGSPKTEHEEQLKLYAAALTAMGFTVKEKKLIYVYKTRILVNNV